MLKKAHNDYKRCNVKLFKNPVRLLVNKYVYFLDKIVSLTVFLFSHFYHLHIVVII